MKTKIETRKSLRFVSKVNIVMALIWIISFASQSTSFATTVVLQWNTDTDPSVSGYKVYYQADSSTQPFAGTGAAQGAAPVDIHNLTSATIGGLDPAHAYYFAVTAYNASGVESSYSNIVAVPELVPPTVSLSSPANNTTQSGTVSVTASASDNVGVTKLEFYVNGVLKATDTSTPYVYSWNTSSLAAGSYTLMAKAYDTAGNVGQTSNISVTVVNDAIAPTVSITAPANNATVSGIVTITANANDNVEVSKVEFYENGALLSATNVAPYSFNWNTSTVSNGSYTLTAKAYDISNNVGQSSNVAATVNNSVSDSTAPTLSLTAPVNNSTVSGTVNVTASASDNVGISKVEFYVNGNLQATDITYPYTFNWNTTSVANGTYALSGKAYDAAGNIGQTSNITVTVKNTDTTAPTVSITYPAASATVGGTVSVSATAYDNVGVSKVRFYVNGALAGTSSTPPYSYRWNTKSLANGSYNLSAKGYDVAGNIGQSANVSATVFNDTTAPTVVISSPVNNATVSGIVTVKASASDNVGVSKVEFYVNGIRKATDTSSPHTFSWNTKSLAKGTYTLTAKAYDAAKNVETKSITVYK